MTLFESFCICYFQINKDIIYILNFIIIFKIYNINAQFFLIIFLKKEMIALSLPQAYTHLGINFRKIKKINSPKFFWPLLNLKRKRKIMGQLGLLIRYDLIFIPLQQLFVSFALRQR